MTLPTKDFRDLGIGSFIYAALFLTAGVGLWLAKHWAEWFTSVITGSLVPLRYSKSTAIPASRRVRYLGKGMIEVARPPD